MQTVRYCWTSGQAGEQPELAAQFQVMSIPTLLVIKNGKIVNQSVGASPKNQILELL